MASRRHLAHLTGWAAAESGPASGSEHFFAGAAAGAFPVVGQILKAVPGGIFPFLSPLARIVNITAVGHLALPHIFGSGFFHIRSSPKIIPIDYFSRSQVSLAAINRPDK